MASTSTHLPKHIDNLMTNPYTLPINEYRRIKIYQFIGQKRWLFVPQRYNATDRHWHYVWTSRMAWASFTFEGALKKLGVAPTGMWLVMVFNEITTEVEAEITMLSKHKPTLRAAKWARPFGEGRLHIILPLA